MRRTSFFWAMALLLSVGLAAVSLAADGPKTSEKRDTLLYVRTVPPGAKVLLDGKVLGTSDDLFSVGPGVGTLVIELSGHEDAKRTVTIQADRVTRVELLLKRQGEPGVASEALGAKERPHGAADHAALLDEHATMVLGRDPSDVVIKRRNTLYEQLGLNLSNDQKARIEEIDKIYSPRYRELYSKTTGRVTEDAGRAGMAAYRAALKAGKTPAEASAAGWAAEGLTDEETATLRAAFKERERVLVEWNARVKEVLTDQQRERIDQWRQEASKARTARGTLSAKAPVPAADIAEPSAAPQGPTLIYEVDPNYAPAGMAVSDMDKLVSTVDRRLNTTGEKIAQVRKLDGGRIEIALTRQNDADRKRVERLLARAGTLEFRILANPRNDKAVIERAHAVPGKTETLDVVANSFNDKAVVERVQSQPGKTEILDSSGKKLAWWVPVKAGQEGSLAETPEIVRRTRKLLGGEITEVLVMNDPYDVNDSYLTRAVVGQNSGRPCVSFTFSDRGGDLFGRLTGDHLPAPAANLRRLGIILDGELCSAPAIRSRIYNDGQISGNFTAEEASDLADTLNAGSLPVRLRLVRRESPATTSAQPTSQAKGETATSTALKAQSAKNLKLLAQALLKYHAAHRAFPPAVMSYPAADKPTHSWRVEVLPYLEYSVYQRAYHFDEPWDSPHNRTLSQDSLPEFCRPKGEDGHSTNSAYFALVGPGTIFDRGGYTSLEQVTDGAANTILLVEAKRDIPWTKPEDIPYDPDKPLPKLGGYFDDGFHVAMADGAVHFLPYTVSEKILRALITRAGNEGVKIEDAFVRSDP